MKLSHPIRFVLSLTALAVPLVVHAVPAGSRPFLFRQPDGTEISLRVRGDEWFHWYETPEGRPVTLEAATGFWVYSVPDDAGKQPPGFQRVGRDQPTVGPWRPHPSVAQRHNLDKQHTAAAKPSALSVGIGFIPVLLGKFSDTTSVIPVSTLSNILFATGPGVRSMTTYYSNVSYGRFTVTAGPSGLQNWVTATHPAAYYSTNVTASSVNANLGPQVALFVQDVVRAAIAAGYNFAPYDQDGDGKVDVVNIVHAGRGEEGGGGPKTIWSHRSSLSGQGLAPITNGNLVIDDYVIQPELSDDINASTIGVFVHEHGHALGLPDLYDNDYSSTGVGDWSGMSFGENNGLVRGGDCPALFDAWCKAKLGWVNPINYTLNYQDVQFPAAATNSFVAKLWKDGVIAKEYYLVENRYRTGFDAALPASGLLIWHIDETTSTNRNEWYPISSAGAPPNTNNGHYVVALMQADNFWQLGITNANTNLPVQFRQNQGDAGDPFPGSANNRVFGPNTSPNSHAYNVGSNPGDNSFVTVSNISDPGPVMTADLYTRSPNSGPLVDWVNIAGVVPPYSGAQFSRLDAQHPVVIRAFPGVSGVALSQVQLYLTRNFDGRWWNFTSQLWETNIPSHNYNVTAAQQNGLTLAFEGGLPSGTNLVNGGHSFIVRVINASSIVTEIQMAMTAARAPEVTLNLVDNSVLNTLTNFTAVATEDSGVGIQRVEIALYYETEASEGGAATRWYWSGYVWTTTPLWLGADFPTHPSQATLYYPIGPDANALQVEKEYVIAARAVDGLGDATTNTISVFYDPGSPATIYWRYAASGSWFDPANWTPSRVPLATDHAVVNAPGDYTVTVNGAATVASLRFGRVVGLDRQHLEIPSGASLTISGIDTNKIYANATLDLGGTLDPGRVQFSSGATWNWTGGTIFGTYQISAGASFNLSGSAIKTLPSGALIRNAGSGTWSGTGQLNVANGGVINNSGTFTVVDDAAVFNYTGGSPLFINTGTFVKAGGTNTSFLPNNNGMAFDNSGIVSVLGGVLSLGGGGTGSNGTFNAAAGAGIDWTAGNVFVNGNTSFSGGGTNRVFGAAMTFGGDTSTMSGGNHFEVAAGSVAGTNSFAGAGFFNWSGGSLGAHLNLGAGVSFNLSGAAIKTLASGALISSAGSGTWSGTGQLNAANGGVLSNSGTLTVLDDAPVFNFTGGSPLFINTGTFIKAGGTNTSFLPNNNGMAFNNSGTVSVLSGILSLGGGGTGSNGTFNAATGSGVDWTAGNVFVNGITSFSGGGTNRVIGAAMTFGGGTSTMSGGNHFEVAAGSVAGTNSFAGTGFFNWSGGSLGANLNLGAGVSFNLSGGAIKTLASGALISSAGSGTWSGAGQLNAANGGVLSNSGTLTVLDDASVFNFTGGSPLFINTGTFVKAGGTNTSFLPNNNGMAFNNSGIVSVLSGVLSLGGGGTGSNGTFNAAAGSGIDWTAGNVFVNGNTSFSGGGTNRVIGAAMTFGSGTSTMSGGNHFEVAAGSVAGTNSFAGAGFFNWSGGSLSANLNLGAGVSFNLSGAAIKTLASGALINSAGSGTWSGTGQLNAANGGVLNNSGTLTVLDDAPVFNFTGGSPLFINTGTFIKAGGTNTSFLPNNNGMAFNNSGTVSVLSGILSLGGGGTGSNGTFNAATGSGVDWTAGNVFVNGNTSFSGGGTNRVIGAAMTFGGGTSTMSGGNHFEVAAGSVAGTNSFAGAGAFNWSGGSLGANLNLGAGVSFNLSGADIKTLASGALIGSAGSGTWSGTGRLNVGNGSGLRNDGTFMVLSDAQVLNYTGGSSVFINNGIFLKTGGTNTSFLPDNNGMAFNNNGTVDLRSGDLTLGAGYTPSPTSQLRLALGGLAAGAQFSQLNLGGVAALAGNLSVTLANGFLPINGNSFAIVNYGSHTSQFGAQQLPTLPAGHIWKLDYGATALTLRVEQGQFLASPGFAVGGAFGFDLTGPAAGSAIVFASTNCVNWDPIFTNSPFNGSVHFSDLQSHQFTNRFYQVLFQP